MRTLVLLAHPDMPSSRGNAMLAAAAHDTDGVTVHDLYTAYPDGKLDIATEQELAEAHDLIVFQFPLHWYSTPPILKQWQDEVLTFGWAYDPTGTGGSGLALKGKTLACALTTGAPESEYEAEGWNSHSVVDFLLPIAGTAGFLEMQWLEPWVLYAVWALSDDDLAEAAASYQEWLTTS
ncbi:MAG: NAD(P)H-dependent oxidoreductase [Acidimicrobiales bacterium]|nr:NAD(P)H-dependent oxidoreductase [Acidimicrobiales bacterium]